MTCKEAKLRPEMFPLTLPLPTYLPQPSDEKEKIRMEEYFRPEIALTTIATRAKAIHKFKSVLNKRRLRQDLSKEGMQGDELEKQVEEKMKVRGK